MPKNIEGFTAARWKLDDNRYNMAGIKKET
jgi:hypothetical protein